MNRYKKSIFARHIVCGWCDRAERRPSQDKLVSPKLYKVSKIRVSAWKLFDLDAGDIEGRAWKQLGQVLAQVGFERFEVEFFAGSDWRGVALV